MFKPRNFIKVAVDCTVYVTALYASSAVLEAVTESDEDDNNPVVEYGSLTVATFALFGTTNTTSRVIDKIADKRLEKKIEKAAAESALVN